MKGKPTSSEFSRKDYVRPNQDWVCGHHCNGEACRIGPSPKGICRATYECVPVLDLKPGETKGHYKCTRPSSAGGKCDRGPMPDGTCCSAVPKCQPRRTLRHIRKRVITFTIIATVLIVIIGLSHQTRDQFTNPGGLSAVHASQAFVAANAKVHAEKKLAGNAGTCAACHEGARLGLESWDNMAFDALKHGLAPSKLIKQGPIEASAMDAKCLTCHEGKKFHQPNMAAEFACHECHKEHQNSGFMPDVNSGYCTSCHGSTELMAASRESGSKTNPHHFPSFATLADFKIQARERPKDGYTGVITAFDTDHPESRLIKEKTADINTLKFNHAVHLKTGNIPKQLKCIDCHERDAKGEYQRPITYEKHCVECHTLQFDPNTVKEGDPKITRKGEKPGIYLPHGDPYYVRAFLRSLNIQYEEYASSYEGISRTDDLDKLNEYVKNKKVGIETLYESGENLERAVFFADMKGVIPGSPFKAPFSGCATCHAVSDPKIDNGTPVIEPVKIPDRWMVLGKFNHDLHRNGLDCLDCHKVLTSEKTSELNLPPIRLQNDNPANRTKLSERQEDLLKAKSCVECHSAKGGIDHRCIRCHTYHNEQPVLGPKSTGVSIDIKESKPAN